MQLLPEDFSKNLLERLALVRDECPEGVIDERLVAPSARVIDLRSEPIQQIIVQTDRDPGLPRRRSGDCAAASSTARPAGNSTCES